MVNKISYIFILVLFLQINLFSQTIRYVSPNGTTSWEDAMQATSWETSCSDLQAVINVSSVDDEIWIAEGIYKPTHSAANWSSSNPTPPNNNLNDRNNAFVLKEGVKIYGGFVFGELEFNNRNHRQNVTVLSGDLNVPDSKIDNAYHVVIAAGLTNATIIDGVFIMNGNADGTSDIYVNTLNIAQKCGGGLVCVSGGLSANNLFVQNNETMLKTSSQSGGVGGGFYCLNATPTITNTFIRGNSSGTGGGMGNHQSQINLINTVICGNYGSTGAALSLTFGAANFINITVSGNYPENPSTSIMALGSQITASNSIIWDNNGTSITGATLTAVHCLMQGLNLTANDSLNVNGNFDGTDPDNSPLFIAPTFLNDAPTTTGNYRLQQGSLAINAGINDTNHLSTDIAGEARIQDGTIDLGAFENSDWEIIPDDDIVISTSITQLTDIDAFNIFPTLVNSQNPQITVLGTSTNKTIEIYNVKGQLIFQKRMNNNISNISLPATSGIYIVKIDNFVKKIVVQ
jgi:hypothetical protein